MRNDKRTKDISGHIFGRLTAIRRVKNSGRRTVWLCKCTCGKIKKIMKENLIAGRTTSCGCFLKEVSSSRFLKDLTGKEFGRLKVLGRAVPPKNTKNKHSYWRCLCICGKYKKTFSYNLIKGFTKSCGCLSKDELKSRRKDFLGRRLGSLIVIQDLGINSKGKSRWKYLCDCGNVGITGVSELNYIKSCGCVRDKLIRRKSYFEYLDKPINFLRIIKILNNNGRALCIAQCKCGKIFKAPVHNIIANKKISCGCKTYNKMSKSEKIHYMGEELYKKMIQDSLKQSTKTFLEKYNVKHPSQHDEIALKIARKTKNSSIKKHWKTKKELICQASWEAAVVDYLNKNKIDFDWQIIFRLPNGSTYRVDLYLKSEDLYVEIKGYMRETARKKWSWFHKNFPNSQLWTKDVLISKGIKI